MKTTETQRESIERGYAAIYVADDGTEYYIESVLDIEGKPSKAYPGCFYVFDADGDVVGDAGEPFRSLEAAKAFIGCSE